MTTTTVRGYPRYESAPAILAGCVGGNPVNLINVVEMAGIGPLFLCGLVLVRLSTEITSPVNPDYCKVAWYNGQNFTKWHLERNDEYGMLLCAIIPPRGLPMDRMSRKPWDGDLEDVCAGCLERLKREHKRQYYDEGDSAA